MSFEIHVTTIATGSLSFGLKNRWVFWAVEFFRAWVFSKMLKKPVLNTNHMHYPFEIHSDKAEILFTNRANERLYEGTLYDLIQPSKLAVILQLYSLSLNKQGRNSFHKQSTWKASWRNSSWLDSAFKASCYIEILLKKTVWINKA